jgi:hypothetical protein
MSTNAFSGKKNPKNKNKNHEYVGVKQQNQSVNTETNKKQRLHCITTS